MKIFYAIQATGNGHIARAIELMPYLQQYGGVDVFLSGSNSNLQLNLPVKYKSNGVSLFYGNRGGLDYLKMAKAFQPRRVWKEAKALPLEKYDLVINDFESITSLACWLKGIPSVNFGHQASFQSDNTPRPAKKDLAGELILKHYAKASAYIGLHFEQYDDFIYAPVVKDQVLKAAPKDEGYVTVYLSHYADEVVVPALQKIADVQFEVFSKKVKQAERRGNVTLVPISNEGFNNSMINSHGIITGAGFETPAEALYMQKKLLCLPIKGQYEQWCNAEALKGFNVPIIKTINEDFTSHIYNWLNGAAPKALTLKHSTGEIIQKVIETGRSLHKAPESAFQLQVAG